MKKLNFAFNDPSRDKKSHGQKYIVEALIWICHIGILNNRKNIENKKNVTIKTMNKKLFFSTKTCFLYVS